MVPAHVQHQVGIPSQLGFQCEHHEDVVQVCTTYGHLGEGTRGGGVGGGVGWRGDMVSPRRKSQFLGNKDAQHTLVFILAFSDSILRYV